MWSPTLCLKSMPSSPVNNIVTTYMYIFLHVSYMLHKCACRERCWGLTTWAKIIYQRTHPWRKLIVSNQQLKFPSPILTCKLAWSLCGASLVDIIAKIHLCTFWRDTLNSHIYTSEIFFLLLMAYGVTSFVACWRYVWMTSLARRMHDEFNNSVLDDEYMTNILWQFKIGFISFLRLQYNKNHSSLQFTPSKFSYTSPCSLSNS